MRAALSVCHVFQQCVDPLPKSRLPLLWRHVVGFRGPLKMFSPVSMVFARAAVSLHELTIVCVFFSSICTTFEMFILCLQEMMFCGAGCLTEVLCWTSWTDSPLQIAQANHDLRCGLFQHILCFLLIILAEGLHICRRTFLWHLCLMHFSHCIISSMITSSVMSVFPSLLVQLRCACVHFRIFFLALKAVLPQVRFCEVPAEWK